MKSDEITWHRRVISDDLCFATVNFHYLELADVVDQLVCLQTVQPNKTEVAIFVAASLAGTATVQSSVQLRYANSSSKASPRVT